jgi:hypothetical protein
VALTVGVDRSMAALQRARRLHPAVAFVQADVLELPFAPAGFEVVLDRGCWHYLRPPTGPATPLRSGVCCALVEGSCCAPACTPKGPQRPY